ncbi:MAG: hypothetical protein IKD31_05355 [Clostridia bacterium]|nr:hypothetical protein [Clostridia bacterium]
MEQIKESLSVLFISPTENLLATLMWCVLAGVFGVYIYLNYRNATLGRLVRILCEKKAHSAESAVEAETLGKALVNLALKGKDRLVVRVEEEGSPLRLYLPEDRIKKGNYLAKSTASPWWLNLLVLILFYIVMVILYYILPVLFDLPYTLLQ